MAGHMQKGRASVRGATIARNESLTFTNEDSFIHQVYVDGCSIPREKSPGEVLNESFREPWTFQVRCHIHPTMRLIVL
jgi:hypothetical protein